MAQKSSSLKKKSVQTVALAIALPNLAFAATAETPVQLPTIHTTAEQDAESYHAESASTKRTEKLLNTAKTVQVLTEKALKDQGLLSLQQALATTQVLVLVLAKVAVVMVIKSRYVVMTQPTTPLLMAYVTLH